MDNIERKKAQQRSNHVLYAKLLIWTGFTFGVVSVPWDTSGNRISSLAFLTQTFSKGKGNITLIEMIYYAYSNNSGRYHSAIFVHCQLLYNDGLMKIVCKEQFRGRFAQFTVYSWDCGGKCTVGSFWLLPTMRTPPLIFYQFISKYRLQINNWNENWISIYSFNLVYAKVDQLAGNCVWVEWKSK